MKITIFDTTLRDGELALTHKLTLNQKLQIALLLDEAGIDVIEVGYPGAFRKDMDEIFMISKQVKHATICGLASSQHDEIAAVAVSLKPAARGRINVFTPVRLASEDAVADLVETIRSGVSLARDYCEDVEWSAFDATRSHPDILCRAVETAIQSGARTIAIPDSMGVASAAEFVSLLEMVQHRVPNIDQATLAVHCHDDLGLAVNNSLAALAVGVRQVECSVNGLGARAGNADLAAIVDAILHPQGDAVAQPAFSTSVNSDHLPAIARLVAALTADLR